jgi:hypothetical protein
VKSARLRDRSKAGANRGDKSDLAGHQSPFVAANISGRVIVIGFTLAAESQKSIE